MHDRSRTRLSPACVFAAACARKQHGTASDTPPAGRATRYVLLARVGRGPASCAQPYVAGRLATHLLHKLRHGDLRQRCEKHQLPVEAALPKVQQLEQGIVCAEHLSLAEHFPILILLLQPRTATRAQVSLARPTVVAKYDHAAGASPAPHTRILSQLHRIPGDTAPPAESCGKRRGKSCCRRPKNRRWAATADTSQ